jgi:outer membrane lipoprotein SlyB
MTYFLPCPIKGVFSTDHALRSWKRVALGSICLVGLIGVVGCSGQPLSTRERTTGIGALGGAATGAIIGAAVGSPAAGAAIGAGLGGVGGFALGNAMQNQEMQQAQTQARLNQQQQELLRQRQQIQMLSSR